MEHLTQYNNVFTETAVSQEGEFCDTVQVSSNAGDMEQFLIRN